MTLEEIDNGVYVSKRTKELTGEYPLENIHTTKYEIGEALRAHGRGKHEHELIAAALLGSCSDRYVLLEATSLARSAGRGVAARVDYTHWVDDMVHQGLLIGCEHKRKKLVGPSADLLAMLKKD